MSVKFYVTPITLFISLYICCFFQHINCAKLDFEQLVKRNRRENLENDRSKQEHLLNVLRLLSEDNYDPREDLQRLGEKRAIGLDFGTARGNSGARQALHLIGYAMANKDNPGRRKRRESLPSPLH